MKGIILLVIALFTTTKAFTQLNDIRLIDSSEYKVDLRLIDDSHGCLIIKSFYSTECIYMDCLYKQDTINLSESSEIKIVDQDVFYSTVGYNNDSILIETTFEHVFVEGNGAYENFHYEIEGTNYFPIVENDINNRVKIKRPKSKVFIVNMFDGKSPLGSFNVHLKSDFDVISIKRVELSSNNFSSIDFHSLFPRYVNIKGSKMLLIYE